MTKMRDFPRSPKARILLTALFVVCTYLVAGVAQAQVVVLVNGAPITEMDIAQRSKLFQLSTHKSASRKEVIDDLINDHLKIFVAKRYGLEITDTDVNNAFATMAQRSRTTPQQLEQSLTQRGVSASNLKLRIRGELGWAQLVRGRFTSSLQVGEADIRNALQARGEDEKNAQGYTYRIQPIIVVGAQGDSDRRREAEALRSRFNSCDDVQSVRAMRGVVVKQTILRNSADLTPQLREMLDKIEIGKLTPPEVTNQGIQMFAVCERKVNTTDSPMKRQIRDELLNKRFEAESKKWLQELRKQALIEYRQPQ